MLVQHLVGTSRSHPREEGAQTLGDVEEEDDGDRAWTESPRSELFPLRTKPPKQATGHLGEWGGAASAGEALNISNRRIVWMSKATSM